ncbi:sn-glycerol-3-phosphate ABC transporter ATP-binding protein UgpC [Kineococcus sp. NUM-3379]
MAAIDIDHLVKEYPNGFRGVNDVSLNIADGEFVILVGPSGCGKSTLLRMIVGLEDITDGELRIDGRRVNEKAPRDRNLSMVFQNYALYPHLSVRENIAFPLRLKKGVPEREVQQRVDEAAGLLELGELLERKPAQLSGGQRQRVAMGRAIVRQADAFLFDEPLSNLDAKLRGQMRSEISRMQRRLGTTTVYVTHDQTEAMTLGDRVAVLRKGVLQQVASPRELYDQPVNLFVAGFIGSPPMNFLPARVHGDALDTPFGQIPLTGERADAVAGRDLLLVGIRPEYFEDASLVDDAKRPAGTTFRARIDFTEWLGDAQYAYLPFDAEPEVRDRLRELSQELDSDQLRTQAVVKIDAASRIREGRDADMWVDLRKLHVFDPRTGENLTRDAAAGAALTQQLAAEREEEIAETRGRLRRADAPQVIDVRDSAGSRQTTGGTT